MELKVYDGNSVDAITLASSGTDLHRDGIISGMEISYSGGNINISAGRAILGGRLCTTAGDTIAAAIVASGELIARIDLEEAPTISLLTRAPTTLAVGDLQLGDTVTEVQLATYTASGSAITALTKTLPASRSKDIYVQPTQPANPKDGDLWFY